MTLNEIMTHPQLSDCGKQQEILAFDGWGGNYTVCQPADANWCENGMRFRSLRTARAYALLANNAVKEAFSVLGPDAVWHEAGFNVEAE